jgi:hypothetical protein
MAHHIKAAVVVVHPWMKGDESNTPRQSLTLASRKVFWHQPAPPLEYLGLLSWSALWEEYADHLPTKEGP